jgi:Niemann-Pick C1 protein
MAFHSILKTSADYTSALAWSRRLTHTLSESINKDLPEDEHVTVFTYSIFYVFYEQYLTIWGDTIRQLAVSLFAIFIVSFVLMGKLENLLHMRPRLL